MVCEGEVLGVTEALTERYLDILSTGENDIDGTGIDKAGVWVAIMVELCVPVFVTLGVNDTCTERVGVEDGFKEKDPTARLIDGSRDVVERVVVEEEGDEIKVGEVEALPISMDGEGSSDWLARALREANRAVGVTEGEGDEEYATDCV